MTVVAVEDTSGAHGWSSGEAGDGGIGLLPEAVVRALLEDMFAARVVILWTYLIYGDVSGRRYCVCGAVRGGLGSPCLMLGWVVPFRWVLLILTALWSCLVRRIGTLVSCRCLLMVVLGMLIVSILLNILSVMRCRGRLLSLSGRRNSVGFRVRPALTLNVILVFIVTGMTCPLDCRCCRVALKPFLNR